MPISLKDYVSDLGKEKFRAFIIHAPPEQEKLLSHFASQIPEYTGGAYLDMLKLFSGDSAFGARVDRFTPDRLKELLQNYSANYPVLVVDQMDFLLDTWRKRERQAFYRMISKQWNSFLPSMGATLIFCLQSSTELTSQKITDSHGKTRIHLLSNFNELP